MAPLGVKNVAYQENKNGHRMNNSEWTDRQRHRVFKLDAEERTRGRHFIKRVKERGDTNFQQLREQQKPNR